MTGPKLPLSGVRILDLTRVLAGPFATMLLGDLGASVIKVERRGVGDESRGWGPPFDARGESAYYLCCNRNKLSVAVDLNDPADASLVMQLGAQAVFVGSGIFKSEDPAVRAKAIVEATAHFSDAHILAKVSRGLGEPMKGQEIDKLDVRLAERGW